MKITQKSNRGKTKHTDIISQNAAPTKKESEFIGVAQ